MEKQILTLKNAKDYDGIINLSLNMNPAQCTSFEVAHSIGKAFEKKSAYSQCLPWYIRSFELQNIDEALGMALGICFTLNDVTKAEELLNGDVLDTEGYYYRAGQYQVAFRKQLGVDSEIEALEAFLDIQDEETYMLRLATLLVKAGREKEAVRICRKISRLFVSGLAIDYAEKFQDAIKNGEGTTFIESNPWTMDGVFKHLSFDLNAPSEKDITIASSQLAQPLQSAEKPVIAEVEVKKTEEPKKTGLDALISKMSGDSPEKKDDKVKIAAIIENSLADVVGMEDLKLSMNTMYNMIQTNKKRVGDAILKNNIRVLGPDGCGKSTAAMAVAQTLSKLGVIKDPTPVVTDYYTLVGDQQTTNDNIQKLFQNAEDTCIIIENIHEFDDQGAYGNGLNAIDAIVKAYDASGGIIPIIITGSEREVDALLSKKKKLAELFNLPVIKVGTYTKDELVQIAEKIAESKNLILDDGVEQLLSNKFEQRLKQSDFKYSKDIESMINDAYIHQVQRISKKRRPTENELYVLKTEDFTDEGGESVEDLLRQLNNMTGLATVKEQVATIVNQAKLKKKREEAGLPAGDLGSLHLVFLGNAGTGKTTVARIIGKIYKRLGVLPKGQLIEVTRPDLVSQYVGGTAQQVSAKVKEAMGGILFIDEAYTLINDDNDNVGKEAINTLLKDIEDHRDSLMVILAGYSADMIRFMDQNQGLRSRMPTDIIFEDYTVDEMVQIFKYNVKGKGLILEDGLDKELYDLIKEKSRGLDFGNARGVRNVFEAVCAQQSNRLSQLDVDNLPDEDLITISKEDLVIPNNTNLSGKTIDDYLAELNALTGLTSVKEKVNSIVASARVNKIAADKGVKGQGFGTLHLVFKGNAGTGKTTVARILGNIYRELGALSKGHVVECDRSKLVASYVGQTAPMTKAKVKEARGGVLFIDEAYSLAKGGENDFGKEAIDTLVADIENYRDDFMVIIAGYSAEIDEFLDKNQGLKSRFPNEIIFEDYTEDELLSIFKGMVKGRGLHISDELDANVRELISYASKGKDFGNARGIRNLLDKIVEKRNVRLGDLMRTSGEEAITDEVFKEIIASDLSIYNINKAEKKTAQDYINELHQLTGLGSVKEKVDKLVALQKANEAMKAAGLNPKGAGTLHMVFKGNAGTGKTTVARLMGNIYRELGVLSKGHVVECDRSKLVSGYVGQTAQAVKDKVKEAMGGVLFIDEAYTLAKGGENDFGKEAIDTLVADIENYREDLMVIIAGYSDEMDHFLSQNQGLSSRFPNEIIFEDYSLDELLIIFKNRLKSDGLIIDDSLDDKIKEYITKYSGAKDFGNARGVRNLVDRLIENRSLRIADSVSHNEVLSKEDLQTVTEEDITKCM